ncbi:MAG TPA: ABC transporter substrate-binding protein [Telmatospirillum sp.]|nr:ABC transporter substrate-binding protein [Telmatospirillum sp.]
MKQTLRIIALATIVLGALASGAFATDLNVGFVGDFSGVGANMAQDQLDGFKLGVKHLGGRIGGNEFTLSVADGRHDPKITRQAVERMQQSDRQEFLLLSIDAGTIGSLVPVAIAGKTLMISLGSPSPNLAGKDCSASFFSLAGLTETAHDLSGQFLQSRGYKTVVVAGPDSAAARAATQALKRSFKGQIIEVTSRHGEMNFTADLRAIWLAAPDAVYLLHTGGMAVNFIRQSTEVMGKERVPLYGPPGTLDQTVLAASGPSAQDIGSIGFWSEDIDNPVSRRMQTDFEADYGRPASSFAAIGYDAAMLLDATLRAVDKKNFGDDALRTAMRRVEFVSTRGTVRFDSNQFPIQNYLIRQVVQDGRDRMVNEQHGVFLKDVRDGHAGECPMRWSTEPIPKGS